MDNIHRTEAVDHVDGGDVVWLQKWSRFFCGDCDRHFAVLDNEDELEDRSEL
jgi:hypothetical protein